MMSSQNRRSSLGSTGGGGGVGTALYSRGSQASIHSHHSGLVSSPPLSAADLDHHHHHHHPFAGTTTSTETMATAVSAAANGHHHHQHPAGSDPIPLVSASSSSAAAPSSEEASAAVSSSYETELSSLRAKALDNAEHAAAMSAKAASLGEELKKVEMTLKQWQDAYQSLSGNSERDQAELSQLRTEVSNLSTRLREAEDARALEVAAAAKMAGLAGDGTAQQEQFKALLRAEQEKAAVAARESQELKTRLAQLKEQLDRALSSPSAAAAVAAGVSSGSNATTLLSWDVSSAPKLITPAGTSTNKKNSSASSAAGGGPLGLLGSLTKLAVFASFPLLLGLGLVHLEEALVTSTTTSTGTTTSPLSLHLARAVSSAQERHPMIASRVAAFSLLNEEADGCLRLFGGKVKTPLCFSRAVVEKLQSGSGGDAGEGYTLPSDASPTLAVDLDVGGEVVGEGESSSSKVELVILSEGTSQKDVDAASAAGKAAGADVVWLLPNTTAAMAHDGQEGGVGGLSPGSFLDLQMPSSGQVASIPSGGDNNYECNVCGMEFVAS
jgi:hypothetical protein